MQHFSNFSSDDGTEKESKGSWARDAAIGGLEGGLAIHLTEPLVNKWTGGATHGAENAAKQTLKQQLISGGKKTAIAAGVGAVSTLAVGAGLNAIGGLLKKKPKPEADPTTQQQAQYSYQGNHFADFVSANSFGTQSESGKDAQWLMKNDREGYEDYKKQGRAQSDKLRANPNLNTANEGLPTNQINKNINKTVVNNLATKSPVANVKGFLGKAKNTLGRYGKTAAGLGGVAMTGMYVLPMLGGLLPQGQQQQQQQDAPY